MPHPSPHAVDRLLSVVRGCHYEQAPSTWWFEAHERLLIDDERPQGEEVDLDPPPAVQRVDA